MAEASGPSSRFKAVAGRLASVLSWPYRAFRDRDRNVSYGAALTPEQELEREKQHRRPGGGTG